MSSTTLATIVDGVIALAIIAAAATLLALHDLSENTAIALFGVAVVQIGGSAKALLALHVPAPPATSAPAPAPGPQMRSQLDPQAIAGLMMLGVVGVVVAGCVALVLLVAGVLQMLDLSPAGLAMIARFEGYRRYPYNDAGGNATIGYGHLLHLGPVSVRDRLRYPVGLSTTRALALLRVDCGKAIAGVRACVHRPLSVPEADALVSFTFNCGAGALAHSTLLKDVNADHVDAIADDFLRWDHVGGEVSPGLHNRRQLEARLYLHALYS